jgi:tetratricopeptide (TPR) repeat protein
MLKIKTSMVILLFLASCAPLQEGVRQQESQRPEQAIRIYQNYLREYPKDANAHNNLGTAYLQVKNYEKAFEHLQQAVALVPQDKTYQDNLQIAARAAQRQAASPELKQKAAQLLGVEQVAVAPTPPSVSPILSSAILQQKSAEVTPPEQTPSQVVADNSRVARAVDYANTQRAAVKWAVVIGVSDYDKTTTGYDPLPAASKDAQKVYDYLTKESGFDKDHVRLLKDKDATAENIRDAFKRFLYNNANNPNDIVFVYYSGHGDLFDSREAYIVPYGAQRNRLTSQAIPLEEIDSAVKKLDSTKIAMFIDSCHSGSIMNGVNSKGVMQKVTGITNNFLDLAKPGQLIMTSSSAEEESLEMPGQGGLFTHYLLEGMRGKADIINRDNKITVEELFQYVHRNVVKASREEANRTQTPQKNGDLDGVLVELSARR